MHSIAANPFPLAISGAVTLPYQDSFLVMGGYTGEFTSNRIYKYELNDTWTLLPEVLVKDVGNVIPFVVQRSMFPDC